MGSPGRRGIRRASGTTMAGWRNGVSRERVPTQPFAGGAGTHGIVSGNAFADGARHRGWFIGHFMEGTDLRRADEVEVKLITYRGKDARVEPVINRTASTLLSLALLAGCATRADLLQVQNDQREVRALLADQQVAVEGLRRRLDIMRGEMSEGGRRGGGGGTPSDVRQQLADLESRMMALEQGRGLVVPTPPGGSNDAYSTRWPAKSVGIAFSLFLICEGH